MSPLIRRYVAFLSRYRYLVATLALLLFGAAVFLASKLELRTDLAELLPADDPVIRAIQEQSKKVPSPATLVVVVYGPDTKANEKFADSLNGKLQPLLGKELRSIEYRTDTDSAYYEHNKALYADLADLERVKYDFEQFLLSKKNPAYVTLDDPEEDLRDLKKEVEDRNKGADKNRWPNGYYEGEEGHLLVMLTWTMSTGTGDADGFQVQSDVQKIIDDLNPKSFGVEWVRITGDVAVGIEEHDVLKNDLELVSILATAFVLLIVILYFRSLVAVSYIFFPTLLGVGISFGLTKLTIGYLNNNTGFLGPIILGNGINFGIILLARFREERAKDQSLEDAVALAMSRTWHPTLIAALAASIAYASLGVMHFRGFSQFGLIGGTGMVLCWIATYTHAPALILIVERWRKKRPKPSKALVPTFIARALLASPPLMLLIGAGATAAATIAATHMLGNPFDYDLRHLRNQKSVKDGAGELYGRAGRFFPGDLSPVATTILDDRNEAPMYRTALLVRDCKEGETHERTPLAQDAPKLDAECHRRVAAKVYPGGMLGQAANVLEALPKDQDQKMVLVRGIWKLLDDPAIKNLKPEDRKEIDRWAPPRDLREIQPEDLPDVMIRHFRERDGTVGKVVLVFPEPGHFEEWDGRVLLRMADLLTGVKMENGKTVDAVGYIMVFGAMMRSIAADGPMASLIALIGVCVLVGVLLLRPAAILLVLVSLLAGVIWMLGVADKMGLKFNFLSFIAVPVTLGIGVDYAVNVYARLRHEPRANFARALGETGSAVTLCSCTTIIGYSTLLTADSGALQSLGKMANLGELGCLLAALVIVPAVMTLVAKRREKATSAETSATPAAPAA